MTWIAIGTGVLFGAALLSLVAFFLSKDERYDRVAEWAFVGFGLLAVPTILAVADRLAGPGPLVAIVTALGLAGAIGVGLGELVLAVRLVAFTRLAAAITLAFLGFLAWIGGVSLLVVVNGTFPAGLGWLGAISIAVGGGIVAWLASQPGVISGQREPNRAAMVAFGVPMAGIVAWILWLGASL